jgi:hypothetical protein
MSMHKLTVGDGYAYLTRHVAAGDADLSPGDSLTAYYEQTGNPAGRWLGRGLESVGDGHVAAGSTVTELAMTRVFRDGCDPVTSAPLGRPHRATAPGEGWHAVAGYDFTFTAPKSVSVAWGLADESTRATLYGAHRAPCPGAEPWGRLQLDRDPRDGGTVAERGGPVRRRGRRRPAIAEPDSPIAVDCSCDYNGRGGDSASVVRQGAPSATNC